VTEKYLSRLYDHGVLEAASPMVGNTFERLQAGTHDNARAIFTAMQERGWYNLEQAARNRRVPKGKMKQTAENFDMTANSKYAVSSGTKRLGKYLPHGKMQGRNGIFADKTNDRAYQKQH
jgi:hypothetical protein